MTHRSLRSRLGLGVAAVLAAAPALTALPAAPAAAATPPGSIVFVKNDNVWIADGDGGHLRQVTTGGTSADPWQSPTQSDDSDPFWSPAEVGETPDAPQALDVVTKPKITGTARAGKVLKASHGTFKPAATSYAYQWTRDGKAIPGARKATYRLTTKDKGHTVGLTVAAARSGWLATVVKAAPVRVR